VVGLGRNKMSCLHCNSKNDDWTSSELIEIVNDLNEKYFGKYHERCGLGRDPYEDFGWLGFSYETSNFVENILFNDVVLWCSDNDERSYCRICDEHYEDSIWETF
jgi:hypothetical protein